MTKIDARGLSCPQPVVKLKKAMEKGDSEYQLLTDARVCVENCTRFAVNMGYNVKVETTEDEFTLIITK